MYNLLENKTITIIRPKRRWQECKAIMREANDLHWPLLINGAACKVLKHYLNWLIIEHTVVDKVHLKKKCLLGNTLELAVAYSAHVFSCLTTETLGAAREIG